MSLGAEGINGEYNSFPQQVSTEQDAQDRSQVAFSNGASFPTLHLDGFTTHLRDWYNTNNSPINNTSTNLILHQSSPPVSPRTSHRPPRPPRHPEYADYSQRLKTYARWTLQSPGPARLSETGLFFTNEADLVRCYQCGIGLKSFSRNDDPLLEHVRYSGDCPFLLEYLGSEDLLAMEAKCQSEEQTASGRSINGEISERQNKGIRYPQYQSLNVRMSSYHGWPRHLIQKPEDLAEAGLFYIGLDDQVRCFTCGGGLKSWSPEDSPWTEHCRWFPRCPFAREKKGDNYIALVQEPSACIANGGNLNRQTNVGDELTNGIEQLTLRDPEIRTALDEHRETCLEMGFQATDVDGAIKELRSKGNIKPTLEDVLDQINIKEERKKTELLERERRKQMIETLEGKTNETPFEENKRLKSLITCMFCGKNNVNALFLPCTHHKLCMECSEPLHQCPICDNYIRQKVKTYLA